MSFSPIDGVLLHDPRPPIAGSAAMLLHLRVARRQAAAHGWPAPSLDTVKARAQACQELLAQGLLPPQLRDLQPFGLDLGSPAHPHSLRNLVDHLEAYLAEVDQTSTLEPDAALWKALDAHLAGRRGLWVERTLADGPIAAGLRDLLPTRLRALACVPELAGATFSLATRKGGARSGLFGGSQPLTEWFLDGVEQHGQAFPNDLQLTEPEGWGRAPWTEALDGLFEGPLDLGEHQAVLRRALVEGPVDLLRQAVEQLCLWLDQGLAPRTITVVHPQPQKVAAFLAPILAQEGIPLHVRGGLVPLIESAAWSPIWILLQGLSRLDPCAVSAGLRASRRKDLRQWADVLANADQDGLPPFTDSFMHLQDWARGPVTAAWTDLLPWRQATLPAEDWAVRLEALAAGFRLAMDADDFYGPLGMLKEDWRGETWTFQDMLLALRAFLETTRSTEIPRAPEGLRLVAPGTLLDDWDGCEAALILDLSEGAWPGSYTVNPDLDWNRKAALNRALADATRDQVFPPALQRFWLPRAEHGDQLPRAFQQEAYAFNKLLAMTARELVALSPAQDEDGRTQAQGPFWTALEGAGTWTAPDTRVASRLRWSWEGHDPAPAQETRAEAAQARTPEQALKAAASEADRIPDIRTRWLLGATAASPTPLQTLAACPFRSMAERVLGLRSFDARSRYSMAVGILAHHVLQAALAPYVDVPDWPEAFLGAFKLAPEDPPDPIADHFAALWAQHRDVWLADLKDIPPEQWPKAEQELLDLLPNLAAALAGDARASIPTKEELALLFPPPEEGQRPSPPPEGPWSRRILALEGALGPADLPLGGGRTLAVQGKLDRLERWDNTGHTFLRVLDYKSSKTTSLKAYAEPEAPFGSHLQTTLYMLLAEQLLDHQATAVLVPLRDDEPMPSAAHLKVLAAEPGEGGWRARLIRNLARLDTRLETGDFPPTPGGACRGCELGALCGRPADVEVDDDDEAEA